MRRSPLRVLAIARAKLRAAVETAGAGALPDLELEFADDDAALEVRAAAGPIDCVLAELADGRETADAVLRRVRNRGIDAPVILVGENAAPEEAVRHLRAGAADYLDIAEIGALRLSCSVWNAVRAGTVVRRLAEAKGQQGRDAMHDELTGLPNRQLFFDRLDMSMTLAEREGRSLALLMLDLTGLDTVSRDFGQATCDSLLRQVAERLRPMLRSSDALARLDDDEFAITLPTGASLTGAATAADKILDSVRQPYEVAGQSLTIGANLGIALFPAHGAGADQIASRAEAAMRQAQQSEAAYVIYTGEGEANGNGSPPLMHDLATAVERGEIALHYQPKVSMPQSRICGVEALARWQHPTRGMICPDEFVPLAEQSGLIEPLTQWVLETALGQLAAWRKAGLDLTMSVNLSAKSLHSHDLAKRIEATLGALGLNASTLMLEITESAIISDAARARRTVAELHEMGVAISIDDFGTGYTSLSHVRELPVQEIKVDKSFVMNMTQTPDDRVIVGTLIELGHNLGLQVVAEGVENASVWEMLNKLGCNIAQGYYMSKPLEAEAVRRWVATSPWGLAAGTA